VAVLTQASQPYTTEKELDLRQWCDVANGGTLNSTTVGVDFVAAKVMPRYDAKHVSTVPLIS